MVAVDGKGIESRIEPCPESMKEGFSRQKGDRGIIGAGHDGGVEVTRMIGGNDSAALVDALVPIVDFDIRSD